MQLKDWGNCKEIPVIYGILNTITGKWYIGSCHSMKDRIHRHYYYLSHNQHHSNKLQRSWNKYGENKFIVIILKELREEELPIIFNIEESYIKNYNSKENGYNMLDKCKYITTFKLSEEAKIKAGLTHSISIVSINRFTGEKLKEYSSITEAAKDIKDNTSNISQVCKGKLRYIKNLVFVYSKDYDENKDYRVIDHHMKGIHKSEEWKRKARLSNKKAKKVYKYDINNNLISEYISRSEAERQNNFKKEYLRRRLNTNINGYIYTEVKLKI